MGGRGWDAVKTDFVRQGDEEQARTVALDDVQELRLCILPIERERKRRRQTQTKVSSQWSR